MTADAGLSEGQVREHFDADASRFDAIYDEDKGPVRRFVDNVWRGVVRERLNLTLEKLEPLEGKTVLDVGTGSGRYCLAYAGRGARKAVGIDFAPAMIEIARRRARELSLDDRCQFYVGSFPADLPSGMYDAVSAMGFFDYVPDAVGMVRAMKDRCHGRMIMSFPKSREWRVPVRRLRFRLMRCPLFLYSRGHVEHILREAGVQSYEVIDLGRDYVIVADR